MAEPEIQEYVCEDIGLRAGGGTACVRWRRKERVVRCRNCINYRPAEDDGHEDGCALAYAYLFETSPDGFCAWGEPREGSEAR